MTVGPAFAFFARAKALQPSENKNPRPVSPKTGETSAAHARELRSARKAGQPLHRIREGHEFTRATSPENRSGLQPLRRGLASAQSALGSVNTLFLARRGVDGPKGSIKPMKKNGSSGRTRTYNPPVNSRMLCH